LRKFVLSVVLGSSGLALAGILPPDAAHAVPTRRHEGIPSIAVSEKNGRMWATWYAGPTPGEDSNNYVVLTTSADGGKTWKEALIADPDGAGPVRAFDPEIWYAPDGRLRWTWTERVAPLAGTSKDPCVIAGHGNTKDDRLMMVELGAEDEPDAAKVAPLRQIARGVMMCKPIVRRDGAWLFPVAHWHVDHSAAIYVTRDAGRTFEEIGGATVPANRREFEEHNLVELKDGTLRAYMRVRQRPPDRNGLWEADSKDGGVTWGPSRPSALKHTSSRAFVTKLRSGNLLAVKNGRYNKDEGRSNLTAYLSLDEGKTWQHSLCLDEERAGMSYPDGQQLPDGRIVLIYDRDRCGAREILSATLGEDDVRYGCLVTPGAKLLEPVHRGDSWRWLDGATLPQEGRAWSDTATPYVRLPDHLAGKVPGGVWGLSRQSSGICYRFRTDSRKIRIKWNLADRALAGHNMTGAGRSGVDVYGWDEKAGWRFVKGSRPKQPFCEIEFDWQPGRPCLVYLPLYNIVTRFELGVLAGATVEPLPPRANGATKPVVCYGTSITHGGSASRPGLAWTAIAARLADVPFVDLGFAGSGRMEPEMVTALSEIDASLYVLDCLWNMSLKALELRFEPFVRELRRRRPSTPILCAEDCNTFRDRTEKGRFVERVIAKLKAEDPKGWANLHFISNLEQMARTSEETVDGCHPNDLGMMSMGQGFARRYREILNLRGHGFLRTETGFGARPILIYNEDSDNVFRPAYHAKTNRYEEAEFRKYLEAVIGPGKITHFFMNVGARVANFPSKVTGTYWDCLDHPDMDHPAWIAAMKDFVVTQGKDHISIWTDMCREKGVSPWLSVRMNDIHCVFDPKFFANVGFWKDHPECWCEPHARTGGWDARALDYSHKAVRDWMLAFIAETLERYDTDGIEIDWMRFERHLPKGRERELSGALDETMREIRKLVDATAKRRGHPILVAARVDSDPRSALNHGTDWRVWTKEGLVDWLIPCNFFATVDFELPYARWVGEVKRLNPSVTVIPGLDCGVTLKGKRRLLTADEYCAWGERMDNQGAPGAYFFNLFSFYSPALAGCMGGGGLEPWQVIVKDGFTSDVIRRHKRSIPAGAPRECAPWLNPETVERDLVVYGSSPAALTAAIEAKAMGRSVVIVSPETRIGGLTTGGLGQTDIGNKAAFGGLALAFYREVAGLYRAPESWTWQPRSAYLPDGQCAGTKGEDSMWTFEPSAALKILEGWERRHALDIRRGERLDRGPGGVERKDGCIVAFRTLSGDVYRGKVFVDATYEGDLMAAAGVSSHIGREDNSVYGETLNGAQPKQGYHHFNADVSPYVKAGDPASGLLPGIESEPLGAEGAGDRRVQAYCFRMCLTDATANRIPFAKPSAYDARRYELLLRNLEGARKFEGQPWINSKMPNRKTDTNNRTGCSTDFIGQNHTWPEASYDERDRLLKAHLDYQQGLMWTLANHPRVPAVVRNEVSRWGTCRDEFADGFGCGWQRQLYVREARRLVGETVMTERHCRGEKVSARPVAMAAYQMDSHHVRRYVGADGFVHNEGDVEVGGGKPYPIDYGAITPKRAECTNLLVPVCVSASHIAFGSIRMEPVFFALGQAAGAAAALAAGGNGVVQDVDYARLRERLLTDGQVLSK